MTYARLRGYLHEHGAKPCHETRLLRQWLHAQPWQRQDGRMNGSMNYPGLLSATLPRLDMELFAIAKVRKSFPGEDGSERLLVELADGQLIESVMLPKAGLCVSTQVGCAVGCVFCMTGQGGLERQLTSLEIVVQLALARRSRPIRKVVFMGMGEPAHNLEQVMQAIDLMGSLGGIAHKNLVLSTVGDKRVFACLGALQKGMVRPALAISLHAADAVLRRYLLPHAPLIDPQTLVEAGEHYAPRDAGYPIQYQWTLIDGVNDTEAQMHLLIGLLKGKYAMMNFIAYNLTSNPQLRRPSIQKMNELTSLLRAHGIIACLRNSVGQDVEGACGQLRLRHDRSLPI